MPIPSQTNIDRNFSDSLKCQPNNFADSDDEEGVLLFMPQNSIIFLTGLKHG